MDLKAHHDAAWKRLDKHPVSQEIEALWVELNGLEQTLKCAPVVAGETLTILNRAESIQLEIFGLTTARMTLPEFKAWNTIYRKMTPA